ncbi:trehalose-phosphatase [Erythrobacter sp. NE805]|uniref:trehalose-phosphatase n=1 Tax=Erythrobacter sp. NE805 TaxID=3389875 RepID=UPI00396AEFEA
MLQRRGPILPPPPLAQLQTRGRVALLCDFDGTIVPIANRPDAIVVPPALPQRLEALAERLDGAFAIVSGRSVSDLQRFIGPIAIHWAGSHGADVRSPEGEPLSIARVLPMPVTRALAHFAGEHGLLHEPKAHGAALHYRSQPEDGAKARAFAEALAAEHGLVAKPGKCVIELAWPGANKGGAVRLLATRPPFAGSMPIFIGDDITDEDGFAASEALGGFGIAVGERAATGASYALGTVEEVHAWLGL